ncbi:Malate dehydrogenase 1- mitochondrial [Striga hermonthica]|uniref:malate dehydrogenase n=1 Tax=Striga hermonthica TaxID=68872 RepID=A0A9N7NGX3_STRHE|nr:Malate dehydrogenase 1- mitochondrial [Striga hermonthica]
MRATMLRSVLRRSTASSAESGRDLSLASEPELKVAVLGARGGIRQPLSFFMKLNPLLSNLALYDIAGTPSVAADVTYINTRSEEDGELLLGLKEEWGDDVHNAITTAVTP